MGCGCSTHTPTVTVDHPSPLYPPVPDAIKKPGSSRKLSTTRSDDEEKRMDLIDPLVNGTYDGGMGSVQVYILRTPSLYGRTPSLYGTPSGTVVWTRGDASEVLEGSVSFFRKGTLVTMTHDGKRYVRTGNMAPSSTPAADEALTAMARPYDLTPSGRRSLDALLTAQTRYSHGDVAGALAGLQSFWATQYKHNKKGSDYKPTDTVRFGDPCCYTSLRLMTEALQFSAHNTTVLPQVDFVVTVLAAQSLVLPDTTTTHSLHPTLSGHGNGEKSVEKTLGGRSVFEGSVPVCVRECLYWWGEHLHAATKGVMRLRVRWHDVATPIVGTTVSNEFYLPDMRSVEEPSQGVNVDTDAWLLIVPRWGPDNAPESVVRGCMATLHGKACFVADDAALTARSGLECAAGFTQWLLHEQSHAMHSLYFPEFRRELEPTMHSWQDRSAWPRDFAGSVECDYFLECFQKRFCMPEVCPPLWARLKKGWGDDCGQMDVCGRFVHEPEDGTLTSEWDDVTLTREASGTVRWKTRGGLSWVLRLDHVNKALLPGPGTPDVYKGIHTALVPVIREGLFAPVGLGGIDFGGKMYKKRV